MQSVDTIQSRAVNTDGAGGKLPSPVFGRTINLTQTVGGADYAQHIALCSPGFSDLPTALWVQYNIGAV